VSQQILPNFSALPQQFRVPNLRITAIALASSIIISIFGQPAPAGAVEGSSLRITGLEISQIQSPEDFVGTSQLVQLQGTFTNFTAEIIPELDLDLVSTNAIRTRGELGQLVSSPNSAQNLKSSESSARIKNIDPGETKLWRIAFRGDEVLGENAAGVFGIGVKIANTDESVVTTTPWFFNSDIQPTEVALVIPLTTLNKHLANGEVADVKNDLSEARRLTNLIGTQSRTQISWLQDSALTTWVEQLDAATESGVPTELNQAISGLNPATAFLPFGHTDLGGLVRANEQDALFDAINQTQVEAGDRQIIYSPIQGFANRQTVSLLAQQDIRTLLSNQYLRGDERLTTPGSASSASNPVLVYDLAASDCLSMVDDDGSFFLAQTCLRSEIGMMTAESPQRSRSVIVLAPTDMKVSSARLTELVNTLTNENWVKLTDLNSIANLQPVDNYVASINFEPTKLSKATIRQAVTLQEKTEILNSLFVEQNLASGFTESRILGFSDLWPSNAQATQFMTQNLNLMNSYLNALSIQASSRITTPEANSEIPITIVNDSDQTVFLAVELTSNATSRFSADPTELVQVDSGQRVTIPVQISLLGAGIVSVQAQLVAPNGERFGEVEDIQISSAAYSQFARTLVWIAFGLLVLLAAFNVIRRSKQGSSKESATR
jgi:hypothetical protein